MIKGLWQRFVNRNRRILAEVVQIQVGMAKEDSSPPVPIFPHYVKIKQSTAIVILSLVIALSVVLWATLISP